MAYTTTKTAFPKLDQVRNNNNLTQKNEPSLTKSQNPVILVSSVIRS